LVHEVKYNNAEINKLINSIILSKNINNEFKFSVEMYLGIFLKNLIVVKYILQQLPDKSISCDRSNYIINELY
jgi:hypothetical protein